jgi:hypothetical protein
MSDRDLDITKFSYSSYRNLKKNLGEFDAVVECNEIAIREFIEKAGQVDSHKYIQQLSSKHMIKVDEVDFIKFSSRIRQYYVASVFQQFEQFLSDFKDEWKGYFIEDEWTSPVTGETKLNNCLRNIKISIATEYIECFEYYRLVRNFMAHTNRDIKELNIRYKKLEKNKNDITEKLKLGIFPNTLEKIDFYDFRILTNLVKHIAFVICSNSKPCNQKIGEVLFKLSRDNEGNVYRSLKKLKNNEKRYEKALNSFLVTTFGRFSEADSKDVINKFKSLLA